MSGQRFRGSSVSAMGTDAVQRYDDLLGDEEAKRADDRAAFFPVVDQFLYPEAVHLGHDEVEVAHGLGPMGLLHEHLGVKLAQRPQQDVVLLEVQAEVLPHSGPVIRHG
jgi:hypothetical protein